MNLSVKIVKGGSKIKYIQTRNSVNWQLKFVILINMDFVINPKFLDRK